MSGNGNNNDRGTKRDGKCNSNNGRVVGDGDSNGDKMMTPNVIAYMKSQAEVERKYGESAVVVYKVGSFYEFYEIDTPRMRCGRAKEVARLLDIDIMHLKKGGHSENNPYVCGVPVAQINKWLRKLTRLDYTVVVYDQVKDEGGEITRVQARVVTPSTYGAEDTTLKTQQVQRHSTILACVLVDHVYERSHNIYVGLMDMWLGTCELYHSYGEVPVEEEEDRESSRGSAYLLKQNLYHMLHSIDPCELLVIHEDGEEAARAVVDTLNLKCLSHAKAPNAEYGRASYQNQFLERLFPCRPSSGLMSPLEWSGMSCHQDMATCYVYLVQFVYECNPEIVCQMSLPTLHSTIEGLCMNYDSLYQLHLFDQAHRSMEPSHMQSKYHCLYDVIRQTATKMGERMIRKRLAMPLSDPEQIESTLRDVSTLIELRQRAPIQGKRVESYLNDVCDLDMYVRNLRRKHVPRGLFGNLVRSCVAITELNSLLGDDRCTPPGLDVTQMFVEIASFLTHIFTHFRVDDMKSWDCWERPGEYFATGDPKIVALGDAVTASYKSMMGLVEGLNSLCDVDPGTKAPTGRGGGGGGGRRTITKNQLVELNLSKEKKKALLPSNSSKKNNNRKNGKPQPQPPSSPPSEEVAMELDRELDRGMEVDGVGSETGVVGAGVGNSSGRSYSIQTTAEGARRIREGLLKLSPNQQIGTSGIRADSIEFKTVGKATLLCCQDFDNLAEGMVEGNQELESRVETAYLELLDLLYKKYLDCFRKASIYAGYVDFVNSGAKVALKFNYCRPTIVAGLDQSFVDIQGMRHPMIEQLCDRQAYVPHDLHLGDFPPAPPPQFPYSCDDETIPPPPHQIGMLLYGVNNGGKSTMLRAVGCCIVLAQIGYYVPAKSMTLAPFEHMVSKISCSDNVFRGKSRFINEMEEVRSILNVASRKTIVLCDELCAGTEFISAAAIVGATIRTLLDKRSPFIITSHMHILCDLPDIIEHKELTVCHCAVTIASNSLSSPNANSVVGSDTPIATTVPRITYHRTLEPGHGLSEYGIVTAQAMNLDRDFLRLLHQFHHKLTETSTELVSSAKTSRYNREFYVHGCSRCGSEKDLHVHHVMPQRDADNRGFIGHVHKNALHNLMSLCRKCHEQEHRDDNED